MRLKSLYTQGKWKKERSQYHPEDREKAVQFFAQAAAVPRLDNVLSQVVPPEQLASAQQRYESLVDKALFQASLCDLDVASARGYLEQIIQRDQTPVVVENAQKRLELLNEREEESNL